MRADDLVSTSEYQNLSFSTSTLRKINACDSFFSSLATVEASLSIRRYSFGSHLLITLRTRTSSLSAWFHFLYLWIKLESSSNIGFQQCTVVFEAASADSVALLSTMVLNHEQPGVISLSWRRAGPRSGRCATCSGATLRCCKLLLQSGNFLLQQLMRPSILMQLGPNTESCSLLPQDL